MNLTCNPFYCTIWANAQLAQDWIKANKAPEGYLYLIEPAGNGLACIEVYDISIPGVQKFRGCLCDEKTEQKSQADGPDR